MLTACQKEKKETVSGLNDPETTPTMLTRDVETLISDSGIMRYRITAPVWYMYEEARIPRWTFPEGLKLEKYDDFFRRQATVECDSATYFSKDELWRLDGHVRIQNVQNDRFLTNQLFWHQKQHKVYSDSFIRIEQPDRTLEGYGFVSNDRLTSYSIRRVSGIFPVESLRKGATDVDSTGRPVTPTAPVNTAPPGVSPAAHNLP